MSALRLVPVSRASDDSSDTPHRPSGSGRPAYSSSALPPSGSSAGLYRPHTPGSHSSLVHGRTRSSRRSRQGSKEKALLESVDTVTRYPTLLRSNVTKEHHESVVHVVLLMAVKQRQPRMIRRELDLNLCSSGNQHHVLQNPARLLLVCNPS